MRPTIRVLLTSFLIAAVAPMGLAVLLDQPAYAKNGGGKGGGGGGKGGDNGGGKGGGGGHGGGKGGQSNNGSKSGGNPNAKGQSKTAKADTVKTKDTLEGLGMAPNELGKLNGVLNASPNALMNASPSSPKGIARQFGATLAGMLSDETPTPEEQQAAMDQLGAMMADMTNKPVTGDQVQAVAGRFDIETTDETADTTTTEGEQTTTEGEQTTAALDQETADAIAAKANEIHGFATGDETAGDETAGDETAGDETAGDETAGDETAGDETAGDETAGDETAGDETAGDETAGDETAGDETSGDTAEVGDTGDETVTN